MSGLDTLVQQAPCSIRGELGAVQVAEEAVQHAEDIVVEELQGLGGVKEEDCGVLGIAAIKKGTCCSKSLRGYIVG